MSIGNKTLFFDIQHRGGDGADLSVAIQRLSNVDFDIASRQWRSTCSMKTNGEPPARSSPLG
jgi:hypothetical protein